ncbi:MAG: hypothetical protein F4027_06825 [Rhodospirillaceae bacterium]|nr:hypothetical protein [Rhodospirillaceae bacterium]MYF85618.1 hypothetical protein [Rhodospirillaceae bacterium]MYH39316.1 hypothetical protein [Rhodospirillaceae bacterium]MYK13712.1 hypothetical protein [Rhodospirillaceae bacterium]MYK58322.1 hypothetical protein [Rhodospirillaceae bacterium]
MRDIALLELLSARGFEGKSAEAALDVLRRCGLTRSGKARLAEAKIEAVDKALGATFLRHCRKSACLPPTLGLRKPVPVSSEHCETCGGSDNRRAVDEMAVAMRNTGRTRLLVAGGSPGTREYLKRLCAGRIDIRFITEETNSSRKTVEPLLRWSDVAAIWTSSEISHKATAALRGPKVLRVPRRGVAALAGAVRDRCRRAGRPHPTPSNKGARTAQ